MTKLGQNGSIYVSVLEKSTPGESERTETAFLLLRLALTKLQCCRHLIGRLEEVTKSHIYMGCSHIVNVMVRDLQLKFISDEAGVEAKDWVYLAII